MNDYRFDALGWYQFEWLVQGLLKSELSLAVESWGGQGDWVLLMRRDQPLEYR